MSSSTVEVVAVETPTTNTAPTPTPRKRRRRTAATGAAEDCHTCRKRGTRCDRRRPYCSQCLEIGKDCSGYRTTLTWGVGVASRGKLRGLSLPIINSTAKASDQNEEPKIQASPAGKPTASPSAYSEQDNKVKLEDNFGMMYRQEISQTPYSPSNYQTSGPIAIPTTSPHHGWHVPGFYEHLEGYSAISGKPTRLHLRPRPLRRVQTTNTSSYDESIFSAPSTASVSTYSESEFGSPSEFPPTPKEVHLAEPYISSFPDSYACQQEPTQPVETYTYIEDVPRSYPSTAGFVSSSLGSSVGSNMSGSNMAMDVYPPPNMGPTTFADLVHSNEYSPMDEMAHQFQYNTTANQDYIPSGLTECLVSPANNWSHVIPPAMDPSCFQHLPPRMRYLIDHYDKSICPVLVAFDNANNPYRQHIMHLAVSNKSVQNAIAALAANNIRMRGLKELSGFSMDPFDHLTADDIRDMHADPTPEEAHYKSTSVTLFNASLREQTCAADDSVLATLLILCLYHVCDSGFTKFKTQLAGVQKLLGMRDRRGGTSSFVGWVEMFFTWFDVMSSTVNDRETQVRGDALDMLDLSANLGALEHLAGCEGRLFKLIARLGRLNLLSQRRPVQDAMLPPSHTPTPCLSPGFTTAKDFYSLDGNGWGTPIPSPSPPCTTNSHSSDPRHEFWTEWHHIRSRLSAWVMDPHYRSAPPAPMSDVDNASIQNISECFRHAALLYTERLGAPHLPPSSPQISQIVTAALRHIAAIPINSCVNKFLLWPVFIVGTECVHPFDRDIIRTRCVEITRESGFFNNMSCLEILERVWAEDDLGEGWAFTHPGDSVEAAPKLTSLGAQAFRWRRAMSRADGEYIVV